MCHRGLLVFAVAGPSCAPGGPIIVRHLQRRDRPGAEGCPELDILVDISGGVGQAAARAAAAALVLAAIVIASASVGVSHATAGPEW